MSQEIGPSPSRDDSSSAKDTDRTTSSSVDEILQTLSDAHRRRLLKLLLESDVQRDTDIPEAVRIGDEELSALQVTIFHVHLPRLEAKGLVDWDRDEHRVVRGPRFDEIVSFLQLIDECANENKKSRHVA